MPPRKKITIKDNAKIGSLITGDNPTVIVEFKDSEGKLQAINLTEFIRGFTADKDERINELKDRISEIKRLNQKTESEVIDLNMQISILKREKTVLEEKIPVILKQIEGKDLSLNSNQIYGRAYSFFLNGDIDSALLVLDETKLNNEIKNISESYFLRGQLLQTKLQFKDSEKSFKQSTALNPNNSKYLFALGEVLNILGEYSESLTSFQNALKNIEPRNLELLSECYNSIGECYFYFGKHKEAINWIKKSLDKAQIIFGDNHPFTSIRYNNLGVVHREIGEYEKAMTFYEKALDIDKKKFGLKHPKIATRYNNIALVHKRLGNTKIAFDFLQKALKIDLENDGEQGQNIPSRYNNLGSIYNDLGDYQKAIFYHKKAIQITKTYLGVNHPELAKYVHNIGLAHFKKKDYINAILFFNKAIKIDLKKFDDKHPEVAKTFKSIGMVYFEMEDFLNAKIYFEKAFAIFWNTHKKHPFLKEIKEKLEIIKATT